MIVKNARDMVSPRLTWPEMDEAEDITEAQRELAEVSIQNGLLQQSLWDQNCTVEKSEVQELSESVLPRVRLADFKKYLAKFEDVDLIRPESTSSLNDIRPFNLDLCRDLPTEFYDSDFCLEAPAVWRYVFPEDVSAWQARVCELEKLQERLHELILYETLTRDEPLLRMNERYSWIARGVMDQLKQIQSQRCSLREVFDDMKFACEQCIVLKRKKMNLQRILDILLEVLETKLLLHDIETMLQSDEAAELHHETIFAAYRDLQLKIETLKGDYLIFQSIGFHQLDEKLSKVVLRFLYTGLVDIFMPEENTDVIEKNAYDTAVKAISRFLEIDSDCDELVACMNQHVEGILGNKIQQELEEEFKKERETTAAEKIDFSVFISEENGPHRISKILSKYSIEIVSRSMRLNEHYNRAGAHDLNFDFVKKSYICLARMWGHFLSEWILVIDEENITSPHIFAAALENLYLFEDKCKLIGLKETTLEGEIQEFGQTLLKKLYLDCCDSIKKSIYNETWQYVSDLTSLSSKLSDLLGISNTDVATMEDNSCKVLLSGKYYGLVSCIDPLLDSLKYFKEYSIIFKECSTASRMKAIEILSMFNRVTQELVLGGDAIRFGKLKSITIKHLSVSCEQISLLICLATDIQEQIMSRGMQQNNLLKKELENCINEMVSHCTKIRGKIVDVACNLMIPVIKDASMVLSSSITSTTCAGSLLPAFTDLIDEMMRNFRIVSVVTKRSLGKNEADDILETIWEENIVWLKDAALSHGCENSTMIEAYILHLRYVQTELDTVHPAKSVDHLVKTLESLSKGEKLQE